MRSQFEVQSRGEGEPARFMRVLPELEMVNVRLCIDVVPRPPGPHLASNLLCSTRFLLAVGPFYAIHGPVCRERWAGLRKRQRAVTRLGWAERIVRMSDFQVLHWCLQLHPDPF
jgi:hypothetical protein